MKNDQNKRRKSLFIDGAKYYTFFNKKFENRTNWEKPNENEVKTFIPGTVTKVFVKEGQKIRRNQKLYILEAMKMSNTVFSDRSGVIDKVYVEAGQKVPKSQIILTLK